MKLKTFMSIAAAVAFLFGLAFLFMPVQTMSVYGVSLDVSGQYVGRYLGSAFLGMAVITWFVRNIKLKDEAMQAILLGTFILSITGLVASLFDVLYGVANDLIWSTVIIYLLLAVGYGYFRFGKASGS
jgi:hypothetical protein